MHDLLRKVKKELDQIGETGINSSNLETTYKLVDIMKDIYEIEEKKEHPEESYGRDYRNYRYYDRRYMDGNGGERSYRGDKFDMCLDKIYNGVDMYEYGRSRYRGNGDNSKAIDGLEKMMTGVYSLVESGIDLAETAEEKEIIRKHIRKLTQL